MSNYFIYTNGIVRGPFDLENMIRLFNSQAIELTTPVCNGKGTPWKALEHYPEIISGSSAINSGHYITDNISGTSVVFYCPHCQQKYRGDQTWINRDIICRSCGKIFTTVDDEQTSGTTLNGNAATAVEVETQDPAVVPGCEIIDWANSQGSIICPHCWLHFDSEHLLYIAAHPALTGDPILGSNAMKRFTPEKFNALGQALDEMSMPTSDVACPRCRLKIPLTVIDEKNFYFSLVGATSSGKSYYLATLLNILRKTLINDFACSLLDVDPEMNQVLDSYESTLFHSVRRHEVAVLPKTQQTGDDFVNTVRLNNIPVMLPKPFVYEMKFLTGNDRSKNCNIIFYDNAGEQFEPGADSVSNPGTRHLACSNGIVFIFDPLNDAVMRQLCNPDEPQLKNDSHVYAQTSLLSEMIARIRKHRNMRSGDKCSIPLVIAAGKYDAWQHLFPRRLFPDMISRIPGKLSGAWQKNHVMDISFSLRELLLEYVPELVNTAEGFFEKVIFVPCSSFGCISSVAQSGQLGVIPEKLNPQWVEQPFLTLLHEYALIEAAENQESAPILDAETVDGFLLFQKPGNSHITRLPGNYAGSVIEIANKRYKLPDAINKESAFPDDLWS